MYYFPMYDSADLYNMTQNLAGAIFGAIAAHQRRSDSPPPNVPDLIRLRRGRAESPAWFLVQALEFDPEPVSTSKLRVRDIYASKRIVQALLVLMASEKWLEPLNKEEYVLTPEGRAILARRQERLREAAAKLEPHLDQEIIRRLEGLLGQIIEAGLATSDPPGSWCLRHSRNRSPGDDASPLRRIIHYGDDFNAFRDDAHMAAWRPEGVDGRTWEAFAFVLEGVTDTARAIDQKLFYRGYSHTEYALALGSLVKRGWLEPLADDRADGDHTRYRPTEQGRQKHAEIEQRTNRYFYAPWRKASVGEQAEVVDLMKQLIQSLEANG